MAAFTQGDFERLDWKLLQNGWVTLYRDPSVFEEDCGALERLAYRVVRVDCALWRTEDDAHEALARALEFPAHYGRNLGALQDSLGDVDVPDAGGFALALRRFDALFARRRDFAEALLDVCATVGRENLLFARRFLTLAQTDDSDLSPAPVGATAAQWNPRERLRSDRGPKWRG
jgi:RNAse (barnase) inhibitor barstar